MLASIQLVPHRNGSVWPTVGAGGGGGGGLVGEGPGGGGGAYVGEGPGGFIGPEGPVSPEQGSAAGPAGGVGVGDSPGPLVMVISAQFLHIFDYHERFIIGDM